MAFDLLLDEKTNDLIFEDGDFKVTTTNAESLRQRISITLKTWQGEWFLDTTFGTPYRQSILGKPRKKEEIDAIFLAIINSFDDVESIDSFSSVYSQSQADFDLDFRVTATDGTVIVSNTPQPYEEEIYTPPEDLDLLKPTCPPRYAYVCESGNWLAKSGEPDALAGEYYKTEDTEDGVEFIPFYYNTEAGSLLAESGEPLMGSGDVGNIPT